MSTFAPTSYSTGVAPPANRRRSETRLLSTGGSHADGLLLRKAGGVGGLPFARQFFSSISIGNAEQDGEIAGSYDRKTLSVIQIQQTDNAWNAVLQFTATS